MSDFEHTQELDWEYLDKTPDSTKSSLSLCISELIDNSINSFESNPTRFNETLTIDIILKKEEGKYRYIISDNANGIDKHTGNFEKDINIAMNTYGTSKNDFTTKSNYGMGLKIAIFWIGKRGRIYTKKNDCKDEMLGYFDKTESKKVKNIIKISDDNMVNGNSGTTIIIEDVRPKNGRDLRKPEYIDNLKNFIGYRFSSYLNEDEINKFKTEIFLTIIHDGKTIIDRDQIKNQNIFNNNAKIFSLDRAISDTKKREEFIYELKSRFKDRNEIFLEKIIEKFENNKVISFDDILPIKCINNIDVNVKIKIAILNSANKHLCGLSIKQSNRYIYHPSTNDAESKQISNYPWTRKSENDLDGYFRWIIGEISLEDIPGNEKCEWIKVDTNKSGMSFELNENNPFGEEEFITSIRNYIKKYTDTIIPFIVSLLKNKESKKQHEKGFESAKNHKTLAECANYNHDDNSVDVKNILSNDIHVKEFDFNNINIKLIDDAGDEEWVLRDISDEKNCRYEFNTKNKLLFYENDFETFKSNFIVLMIFLDVKRRETNNNNISIEASIKNVFENFKKSKNDKK